MTPLPKNFKAVSQKGTVPFCSEDCAKSGQSPAASRRRGVLLLVVLVMLVLFALIGVTFVLVAGQHYRSTKMALRHEQYGDDPRRLCDAALAQIVRDTMNPQSVLRGHSLLNDLYGNDGIKIFAPTGGSIGVMQVGASEQLIDLTVSPTVTDIFFAVSTDPAGAPPTNVPTDANTGLPMSLMQMRTPGYYNGCVLTMLDGPAAKRSTRIVGWGFNSPTYTIRVMAFEGISATALAAPTTTAILINGRPFNGTGFGFNSDPMRDPTTAQTLVDATQQLEWDDGGMLRPLNIPYALLPNPVFADPRRLPVTGTINTSLGENIGPLGGLSSYALLGGRGGADEDYDAPDAQNMLLAHLPLNPSAPGAIIIPSLHRPDTISYIVASSTTNYLDAGEEYTDANYNGQYDSGEPYNDTNPANGMYDAPILVQELVDRQMSLRPVRSAVNHPDFTGSNPSFNRKTGPWDVDNEGDGVKESIWVDIGLPVQTAPDGRTFKPLAAILVLDQDSRLNVNAHGSIAQVEPQYTMLPPSIPATAYAGGIAPSPPLTRGQGYGPAEINLLDPLFGGTATGYEALLAARYREPNTALTTSTYPSTTSPYPGVTNTEDAHSAIKQFEFPVPGGAAALTAYGTPSDLSGRGFLALDSRGMPLTPNMGDPNDALDDPYEFNLSRKAARSAASINTPPASTTPPDNPFTAAELERVLRMYDLDASQLPDRLRTLVDGAGGPPLAMLRNMVTTDSFDLPSPNTLATRELRKTAAGLMPNPEVNVPKHINDLLRIRLQANGCALTLINDQIIRMLPPDLVAGLRMDINRPFGNGRDDTPSNGIVDEPGENEPAFWDTTAPSKVPTQFGAVQPDLTNGIPVNPNGVISGTDGPRARQLYARHLYVLMMLLKDSRDSANNPVNIDFDGNPMNDSPEETARGIAQWAINVVDFRDRDSIMTPFEYTVNPFVMHMIPNPNPMLPPLDVGWTADGDLSTSDPDTEVVWGCERPELLLTETLAFHQRRTEDLNQEMVEDPIGDDTQQGSIGGTTPADDRDSDQRLAPRGALFVEVYNPWATAEPGPAELYDSTGQGVMLNKRASDNNAAADGSPVWRLLIVQGASKPVDLDDYDPVTLPNFNPNDIERSVYFTPPGGRVQNDPYDGRAYFTDNTVYPVAPVPPGYYAVIGPGYQYPGVPGYVTPIGRTTAATGSALDIANTRRIELIPGATAAASSVAVKNNVFNEPMLGTALPAVAIVVNNTLDDAVNSHPLSVSEPINVPIPGIPADPDYAMFTAAQQALESGEGAYGTAANTGYPDIPFDYLRGEANANWQVLRTGGQTNFRAIHLQRLADPTQAWNPMPLLHDGVTPNLEHNPNMQVNPYLTIDSASVDLSVFNGITSTDPIPGDRSVSGAALGLSTFERGAVDAGVVSPVSFNLWRPHHPPRSFPAANPGAGHHFNFNLEHTLGYLNTTYGPRNTTAGAYLGAPQSPFPWLTWNNRPFVGPVELLLVPKSASSRLLWDFLVGPSTGIYAPPATAAPPIPPPPSGHLMKFFSTDAAGKPAPHFYRILEYLQVPSRFVGTETQLDPTTFVASLPNEQALLSFFHPPFNKVSNYRDPGRVNINTIPSDDSTNTNSAIWNAILNHPLGAGTPAWSQVALSRQGDVNVPWDPTMSSTMFANPFRSAVGASLLLPGTPGTPDGTPSTPIRDEVDVTLMRPANPLTNAPASDVPLFDYNSTQLYDDSNRNPYFRIQNLQRVSNLLTTRSNVYAIWVTIGYFEVGMTTPDDAHPDGSVLGQELGADSGEVVRHRAFYIYDRSIPVGFEPGHDHNFEDGLLLRRFIE